MKRAAHYRGRKVFLTGGSSGIGLATARLLVEAGADVWIAARGPERLAAAADSLQLRRVSRLQRICGAVLDVSDREAVNATAARVLDAFGHIDLVICNAGVTHPARFNETPPEVFAEMMRINYFGVVHVTQVFLPHLQARRSGHIAAVSSIVGLLGSYGYGAYGASKFAVTGLLDCLRQELLEYGIGVSVLFPTDTDTPQLEMERRIRPYEAAAVAEQIKPLPAATVAGAFLDGIAENRYYIVPGYGGAVSYFVYRHAPWLVRWHIARRLRGLKRHTSV